MFETNIVEVSERNSDFLHTPFHFEMIVINLYQRA